MQWSCCWLWDLTFLHWNIHFSICDFRKILLSSDLWDFPFSFMGLLWETHAGVLYYFSPFSFVTDACLCLLFVCLTPSRRSVSFTTPASCKCWTQAFSALAAARWGIFKFCVLMPLLISNTPIKQPPHTQSHIQQKGPIVSKCLLAKKTGLQVHISPPKICISS